jgi:hypothetical protein
MDRISTDLVGRAKVAATAGLLSVSAMAFTFGCTAIGHARVEGWPTLEVVEHHVPHHVMRDRCAPYGTAPLACAVFDLPARTCTLWFSVDFPPADWVLRHERMHCEGYDHVGETNMHDFLHRYLESAAVARGPL